jgi:hypothetical protein
MEREEEIPLVVDALAAGERPATATVPAVACELRESSICLQEGHELSGQRLDRGSATRVPSPARPVTSGFAGAKAGEGNGRGLQRWRSFPVSLWSPDFSGARPDAAVLAATRPSTVRPRPGLPPPSLRGPGRHRWRTRENVQWATPRGFESLSLRPVLIEPQAAGSPNPDAGLLTK